MVEEDGVWMVPEGKYVKYSQELWMMGVREVRVQGLKYEKGGGGEKEKGVFPHLSEVIKEMCSEFGVRVLADEGGAVMSRGGGPHRLTLAGAQQGAWGVYVMVVKDYRGGYGKQHWLFGPEVGGGWYESKGLGVTWQQFRLGMGASHEVGVVYTGWSKLVGMNAQKLAQVCREVEDKLEKMEGVGEGKVEVKHHKMQRENLMVLKVYATPGLAGKILDQAKPGLGLGEGMLGCGVKLVW